MQSQEESTNANALSIVRIESGDKQITAPAGGLILIDLTTDNPEASLRETIPALPANALIGLGDCGIIGATRAYRLLAALIEEHFLASEAQQKGSGIRQPIALVLGQNRDPLALASIAGGLLIDGIGDALYLPAVEQPVSLAFTILQAVKARSTRTDYVSCPSCGRTLFDLVETTAYVQEVTNHLEGVTIAIMGCIVNGPGKWPTPILASWGRGQEKSTFIGRKKKCVKTSPLPRPGMPWSASSKSTACGKSHRLKNDAQPLLRSHLVVRLSAAKRQALRSLSWHSSIKPLAIRMRSSRPSYRPVRASIKLCTS